MGYEFLIKVDLSDNEKSEVTKLLKRKSNYSSTATVSNNEFLEFKKGESQSEMPDFTVLFVERGIYVCRNLTADVWTELIDLKEYLQDYKKEFYVEEL